MWPRARRARAEPAHRREHRDRRRPRARYGRVRARRRDRVPAARRPMHHRRGVLLGTMRGWDVLARGDMRGAVGPLLRARRVLQRAVRADPRHHQPGVHRAVPAHWERLHPRRRLLLLRLPRRRLHRRDVHARRRGVRGARRLLQRRLRLGSMPDRRRRPLSRVGGGLQLRRRKRLLHRVRSGPVRRRARRVPAAGRALRERSRLLSRQLCRGLLRRRLRGGRGALPVVRRLLQRRLLRIARRVCPHRDALRAARRGLRDRRHLLLWPVPRGPLRRHLRRPPLISLRPRSSRSRRG